MSKRRIVGSLYFAGLMMLCIVACVITLPAPARAQSAVRTLEDNLKDQINSLSVDFNRPAERDALKSFYAGRQYRPVWVDEAGPTRAARSVMAELERAEDWGLDMSSRKFKSIFVPLKQGRWTAAEAAAAEYEISAAILTYARHARGGRIAEPARTLSSYLDRRPIMPDPAGILAQITAAAEPDGVLRSFHPQHEQFHKLQALYATLRAQKKSAEAAGLVRAKGPVLLPGQRHSEIPALRRRLAVAAESDDLELYDDTLEEAVRKFQEAESLAADGIVGLKTRKALNAGVDDKLQSILANMEQWRWMPDDLGKTHLFVNLPAFTIKLVQDGAVTFEERVIVGKSTTQTPVFSRNLTSVVLKPSWQLPESIRLRS